MDTIPFHFDAYGGLGEVKGLARLDERGLELQFSTSDALLGLLKSDQRSVRVPLDTLLSVRYSAGWLWLMPQIELRVRDLAALKGLPESDEGRVNLKLKLRDRDDGRVFASDLNQLRSRRRIAQLDRALDQMSSETPLPPLPPMVEPSDPHAPPRNG